MINAVIYATFVVAKRKPEKNFKKNYWIRTLDLCVAIPVQRSANEFFFSGFLLVTAKVAYITAMISILHLINHGTVIACVQTSPISFVAFPRAAKEIGDVCTQATQLQLAFTDSFCFQFELHTEASVVSFFFLPISLFDLS